MNEHLGGGVSDAEPTIETIEAEIGLGHFAIVGDDAERVRYLLGQAVGIAMRHRTERDRLRAVLAHDEWAGAVMRIMMTVDGGKRVWGEPLDEQVVEAVAELEAERTRLRADHAHLVEVNAALRTRPDLAERAPLVEALAEERDRYRAGLDTILDGLVGLDSDEAYVAITMEHLNVLRAALKKERT